VASNTVDLQSPDDIALADRMNNGRKEILAELHKRIIGQHQVMELVLQPLFVGGNSLIRTAMDIVRPGGRVLLFAQTQHGDAGFDPAAVANDPAGTVGAVRTIAAGIVDGREAIVVDHVIRMARDVRTSRSLKQPAP